MIETEEQRRWWFATHPEFSRNHKGGRNRGQHEEQDSGGKVRPEDVDAYVDNALKYVDGPAAALLESVKRNFGTAGDSRIERQIAELSAGERREGRPGLPGYPINGGLIVPQLPTLEEVSRWPKEILKKFCQWIDTFAEKDPLLIDPNALERHHRLIKKLAKYFADCGLHVEDFIRILRASDHRLKDKGLHTGKGRGGDWNREWEKFADQYPAKNTKKHQDRIERKLQEMEKKYGVDNKGYLLPPRHKRK
jgi:hypothetical protein